MTWDGDCSGLCLSPHPLPPRLSFAETHHSQRGRADPLRRGRKDPCRAPHPAGRPDGLECGQGWPGPGSEAVLHSPHLDDTGGWGTRQQRRGNSSLCHASHGYHPRLEVAMRGWLLQQGEDTGAQGLRSQPSSSGHGWVILEANRPSLFTWVPLGCLRAR